ncbi:type II secretion system F family protein [Aestuariirhabdus litorea]|uniref:Type II secretion system F family protein n=1 Tax=Aestuariirhabdus litorea TaxID=2528527 RepID=A0A3P3VQF7_9GAMM|nr:type II secretion system F family protein [Aestuariirhabdus litorea]RRJ83886.1 type II secretion system F family protein [Aestuariirhabdus litorea]RWW97108.1 type II secretion system F family protein [Endozoicomonadaceae bacterium GTF-13]
MAEQAAKSVVFLWEGKDKQGRKTKGETSGSSPALVKAELRKQGINPTKVRKKGMSFGSGGKKITPMDIAVFSRQLATMMKAGVPLIQAFEINADGVNNPNMKNLINDVKNGVSGGSSLADALRKRPEYFDDLYCNLVESGEQSGALETLLDRIATYKEKTEQLKAKIKKAMKYPIAVICVAVVVTGILLIKVVPQFEDVFQSFGAELPAFTQFVVGISEFVQEWWFYALLTAGAFGFAVSKALEKSKSLRDAKDRAVLKIPVIGDILYKAAVARFARTLATTFAAGVPLVDALDSVAGAAGNVVFYDATNRIKEDVSTGQQLQFAMKASGLFPPMATSMVSIGEESGALDEMLDKVASYYEEEVDNAVDGLTSLMEPLIMSVLGVLVGGLVVAMYLPIFQLGQAV